MCTTVWPRCSVANTLLDATGPSSIFDGAATQSADGTFLDVWAGENELNTLLWISPDVSETAILTDIITELGIPAGDLPTVGSSAFETDLTSLASADFTAGSADFSTWLSSLAGDLGGTLDLGGSAGEGLGALGAAFTALLADLASAF